MNFGIFIIVSLYVAGNEIRFERQLRPKCNVGFKFAIYAMIAGFLSLKKPVKLTGLTIISLIF